MKVCQLLTYFGGRLSTAVKHTWYYSSSGLTKGECWTLASGSQSTHDGLSASDVLRQQSVHSSEAHLVLQFQRPHKRWSLYMWMLDVGFWMPVNTWRSVSFWRASAADCPQQWSTLGITVPAASQKVVTIHVNVGRWLLDASQHMMVCQLLTCFGSRLSTAVKHTWYYSSSGLTKGGCWAGEWQTLDPRPQFSYTRRPFSFKRGLENIGGLIRGLSSVWSGSLFASGKRRR